MLTIYWQIIGAVLISIGGYVMYLANDSWSGKKWQAYLLMLGAFIVVIGGGCFWMPLLSPGEIR